MVRSINADFNCDEPSLEVTIDYKRFVAMVQCYLFLPNDFFEACSEDFVQMAFTISDLKKQGKISVDYLRGVARMLEESPGDEILRELIQVRQIEQST